MEPSITVGIKISPEMTKVIENHPEVLEFLLDIVQEVHQSSYREGYAMGYKEGAVTEKGENLC